MAVYTVLEPPRRTGSAAERAERFVFIRDGFCWSAFLFGPLWLLYRRLWLVLVLYVALAGALLVGLRTVGLGTDGQVVVGALIELLVGFEAATLRRFTLARRGWRELGSVSGDDLEEAERRFFDAWVTGESERTPPAVAPPAAIVRPLPHGQDVIGLFPEPGGSR